MTKLRLSFALALFAGWGGAAQAADPQLPQDPTLWINFRPLSLESLRGKGAVLYFLEEGCPRCREKWPSVLAASKKYEGQPVVFIAVNSGNDRRTVASYARENNIYWPVIVDQNRLLEQQCDVGEVSLKNIWQMVAVTPTGQIRRTPSDVDAAAKIALEGASWKVDPAGVPAELKPAWISIELGEYAKAGPPIRKALASSKPDVKAAAEKLEQVAQSEISTLLSAAQTKLQQGDKWQAYQTFQQIAAQFQGFEVPDEAKQKERELASDPAVLKEKRALAALDAAKRTGSRGTTAAVRRATTMLQQLVQESPDTEAATEAKAILAKLGQ